MQYVSHDLVFNPCGAHGKTSFPLNETTVVDRHSKELLSEIQMCEVRVKLVKVLFVALAPEGSLCSGQNPRVHSHGPGELAAGSSHSVAPALGT